MQHTAESSSLASHPQITTLLHSTSDPNEPCFMSVGGSGDRSKLACQGASDQVQTHGPKAFMQTDLVETSTMLGF